MTEQLIWHVCSKNEKLGPYSEKEIKELFLQNKFASEDLFWKMGTTEWLPYSKVRQMWEPPAEKLSSMPNVPVYTAPQDRVLACILLGWLGCAGYLYTRQYRLGFFCLGMQFAGVLLALSFTALMALGALILVCLGILYISNAITWARMTDFEFYQYCQNNKDK
jgi:hypothetical protein